MTSSAVLERGLDAFAEQRWADAFAALSEADATVGLAGEDLARLATAAELLGRDDALETATRAHEALLEAGDGAGAARVAAWIGLHLLDSGEPARGGGWLARAGRLSASGGAASVGGLVLAARAVGAMYGGEFATAAQGFEEALVIGERHGDRDTLALARLGLGQIRIGLGQVAEGFALLDEVMVAVTAGEVSPVPAGIAYCAVIHLCHLAYDIDRAREWTLALDHWCGAQPELVAFSGQCQTHRAELYRLHGAWHEALAAAQVALERARRGDRDAFWGAWYQQGEVHRLRGDVAAAEEAYRHARETGYPAQPGLALLRLGQGRPRMAQSLIREAVEGADPFARPTLLPALVEIEVAAHDAAAARRALAELVMATPDGTVPMLRAIIGRCEGAVLLEEGKASDSRERLRAAWCLWQELDAPYEAARCRVLIARACRALGDHEAAAMELDAARAAFAELGAGPDVALVDALAQSVGKEASGPLTPRELDVVRLVAAGKSNRVIAGELYLSEKTVAHHLGNVFAKLGVSSRAGATAYAYEHGLVS